MTVIVKNINYDCQVTITNKRVLKCSIKLYDSLELEPTALASKRRLAKLPKCLKLQIQRETKEERRLLSLPRAQTHRRTDKQTYTKSTPSLAYDWQALAGGCLPCDLRLSGLALYLQRD